jgi:hypothetical protein
MTSVLQNHGNYKEAHSGNWPYINCKCDGSCTCKLDTLFVSAKYVLVSVKLLCVYVKLKKKIKYK